MASKASATAKMRAPRGMAGPGEPERIAGAVPALVVVVHHRDRVAQERDALQDLPADLGMAPHDHPLLGRQGAGLEQDRVGDADLADVVQEDAAAQRVELGGGQAVRAGEGQRVGVHAAGVQLGADLAGGQDGAQSLERGLVGLLQLPEGGGQVAGGLGHAVLQEDLVLAALDEELAVLERALRGEQDLVQVDRLQDEVAGALLEALDGGAHVGGAGEHDHGGVGVARP